MMNFLFGTFLLSTIAHVVAISSEEEVNGTLSLDGIDKFQLTPLNETLVNLCCNQGSNQVITSAKVNLNLDQCKPANQTDGIPQENQQTCSTIFESCCRDEMTKSACDYGKETAMDHPAMTRRLWRLEDLNDLRNTVDHCKSITTDERFVDELAVKSEECCLCQQVERQVVTEENVQIRAILFRFCKRLGCCPDHRVKNLMKRQASIVHYNRPARDALLEEDVIRTDKSIKCQEKFVWDPKESICVRMVIKCPIGMKMDSVNQKCVYRSTEDECDDGYEFDEEKEMCVDIDECSRYKLADLCEASGTECKNTRGSYKCECTSGYQRINETSCHDIDECKIGSHSCSYGQACTNTIGSYRCTRKVPCGYGYTLNENTQECEDIDECVVFEKVCPNTSICKNLRGSFLCENPKCPVGMRRGPSGNCVECEKGYRKEEATRECIDIDECVEGLANCNNNEICVNEPGRFYCQMKIECPQGTYLDEFGEECLDINECSNGDFICDSDQICINRHGSYECQKSPCLFPKMLYNYELMKCNCEQGFVMENNKCIDIDECQNMNEEICPIGHNCLNTEGSFQCVSTSDCDVGYQRLTENATCTDIDECLTSRHKCGTNMICVNKPGSFECQCLPGHIKNSTSTCADIDECSLYNDQELCPDEKSKCINTVGSYECVCPEGLTFISSPVNRCQDVDECQRNPQICGKFHRCINLSGGYRCECATGFIHGENEKICMDIDECAIGKMINGTKHPTCSSGVCVNTPGSFECKCPTGFKHDIYGKCQDINECEETIGACPSQPQPGCLNLLGSYRCISDTCPENYERHKFINGIKCQLPKHLMCNISDVQCYQRHPVEQDKIYFELRANLQVPQILRRITPIKLRPDAQIRADVREHYSYNYETKAPIDVKDSFRLQMSRIHKGRIELVLVKPIPGAVDILLSVYIMENNKVISDTRLYMFVTDSLDDRIKKENDSRRSKFQLIRRFSRQRI